MKGIASVLALWGFHLLATSTSLAAIKTETVEYKDGKTALEGHLAYNDDAKSTRPAVLIVHQWMGLTDYEKMRAQQLAEKGYVAFAIDIYGKGVRPTSAEEAGKTAGLYRSNDTKLYRQRIKAALDYIVKDKKVDVKNIVIIGYCFGGAGALEAARAGFPIKGAVSFHGGLKTPKPQETKNLKPKLLVLHGAIDPNVPRPEVEAFMDEMNNAKADYQFIAYSGAVHAFTQKEAGNDITKGVAYNEAADRRSWQAFMDFLNEVSPVTK
ncbi:MAG: dienelactone hydrolase [Bdellovibrio sp. ArHS]|uniref:dienelactone hydrolase family protein n=1 Tax=Bdellovibrio sp. ArHS TaxID=1569284 RepID=UPI0005836771|nr:dienelactone hydrolase family protein [Bdellovibrio sp. ArHS]KHD87092.1 MAG: dienelactone hydrolase [Bdellovibrio sp. ArHS]